MAWLDQHRQEIMTGQLQAFFEDECHLVWGDLCGYVWGKTRERIEIPIPNERQRQTYYGALNLFTQSLFIQAFEKGNSEGMIDFLKALMHEAPHARIVLFWDGASYHRSQMVKDFLASVNQGLVEAQWKITCIRFAPNDPRQNPIEDVWLQAKRFIREFYQLCTTFPITKWLFEFVTHHQTFSFPKLFMYGSFL
jgi:transposase